LLGPAPEIKSFDVFGLDDEKIFLYESIQTKELCKGPEKLVQLPLDTEPMDVTVGPSGYGIPLKHMLEIIDEVFSR